MLYLWEYLWKDPAMPDIDYSLLERELKHALHNTLGQLFQEVQKSDLFALGLYVNQEFSYAIFTAGLLSDFDDPEPKWLPADWSKHLFGREYFQAVEQVLSQGWSEDYADYTIDKDRALAIYIRVLSELRREYFADTSVFVGLFMAGGWDSLIFEEFHTVNPETVVQQFNHAYQKYLTTLRLKLKLHKKQ